MNKSCFTCKYYNNGKCNNKHIPITTENNIENEIITFIEDGYLQEGIRENLNFKELNNIFMEIYREVGATKKNVNSKKIDAEIEENEIYINEVIDGCISNLLTSYFRNNKSTSIIIKDPYNFNCNMWE